MLLSRMSSLPKTSVGRTIAYETGDWRTISSVNALCR